MGKKNIAITHTIIENMNKVMKLLHSDDVNTDHFKQSISILEDKITIYLYSFRHVTVTEEECDIVDYGEQWNYK